MATARFVPPEPESRNVELVLSEAEAQTLRDVLGATASATLRTGGLWQMWETLYELLPAMDKGTHHIAERP